MNTYGYVGGNPLGYSDSMGLDRDDIRQAHLYFNRRKAQQVSTTVFGCLGIQCFHTNIDGSSTRQEFVPPSLGGGFEFCTKDQQPTSCEKIKEQHSEGLPYPVSNGNLGGTAGKFGFGLTVWKDGNFCISIGLQAGLPGPVADGGDITPK